MGILTMVYGLSTVDKKITQKVKQIQPINASFIPKIKPLEIN